MQKKSTLLVALGFSEPLNYDRAPRFMSFLGVLITTCMLVLCAVIVGLIALLAAATYEAINGPNQFTEKSIYQIGVVLAALLGAPFVVWRSLVAQRQADIAAKALLTERISKVVDQFGSEEITVRVGAVYTLESIMLDSKEDRVRMWTILNAFLTEKQKSTDICDIEEETEGSKEDPPSMPADVQAALTVLTRNRNDSI
ncbi:pentapeptide repeat-containing protein [Actibacterium atlanticum]|uniref:Pentapeptide repeat-containing protein n=1 Tax=Actibacterium atlanticum TaxID=1461693 RepID=A0A058ZQK1_9RHOB|nr:hypothetical protein [Actibacterium atlanticum]KCV83452.1 pentapeptide repeat-containing protein [Actibacterium atlanticum]